MTHEEPMTNGFARIVLVQLNTDEQLNVREHEAIRVAIKALEQQTCGDAVSRKDVLNLVDNLNDGSFRWASIRTKIARLHLVQPELEPCKDAVSRQAVLGLFAQNADAVRPYSKTWEEVKALPSVNPQPKIGHWIGHREHCENLGVVPSGLGAYKWCSNCDCGIDVREWHRTNYNYCPDCGAKMVEPQESEVSE